VAHRGRVRGETHAEEKKKKNLDLKAGFDAVEVELHVEYHAPRKVETCEI